jgi:GAF domain-containing protein
MSSNEYQSRATIQKTPIILKLVEDTVSAQDYEKLAEHFLQNITEMTKACSALLYIEDPYTRISYFFQHALESGSEDEIRKQCAEQLSKQDSSSGPESTANIIFFPLKAEEKCIGLMGLVAEEKHGLNLPDCWEQLLHVVATTISRIAKLKETERKLAYLNTYKTVSSMLTQELCLHDLLEATLFCCMDVISAEAASILMLDDEKKNFKFYQTEGPAKVSLAAETFPADKGLAGSILEQNRSEVINDVRSDPRFYGKIDSESGFQTKNMIAVPLVAGEEKIGVLEVLNKVNDDSFTEDEHLLLSSIAVEIAFAIRNAKVFEYVVNSYCKQRQGQNSCKGCERPLGSWTPCAKYRTCEI